MIALLGRSALIRARTQAEQITTNAQLASQNTAKEAELAARQEQLKRKELFEREPKRCAVSFKGQETRLSKREDALDRKLDTLAVKEKQLDDLEARLSSATKAWRPRMSSSPKYCASSATGCCS